MLQRFPVESKGRRKKLQEVGYVTTICFSCFLVRCIMMFFNAFDKAADLDVLNHPILNFLYYLEAARRKFDELSQNSESDASKLIDQAFLSVMGPEHNGRVKGLGMGPTLRTYYGLKQIDSLATMGSSGSQSEEVERLKGELERMNDKFDEAVREMREEMRREMDRFRTSLLSNTQGAGGNINPIDAFSPNHHQSSNASHEPTSEGNRRTI